jgi:hypothetical protein
MEYPNWLPIHLYLRWQESMQNIIDYNNARGIYEYVGDNETAINYHIGIIEGICVTLGQDSEIYLKP